VDEFEFFLVKMEEKVADSRSSEVDSKNQ
jgi:hypothetical protein